MLEITLPLPVSVNRLWRNGKGRTFRSPQYRCWLTEAGWELRTQRPKLIAGPVSVTIAAGRPDRRRRDIDNLAKSLLDLLVAHQVIEDDANVVKFTAGWDTAVPPGIVRVTIEPATMMVYAKA